jgi:NAD(P)-dependent dehydrogenase (short-subunit alcohol dehydrogenase family)
MYEDFGVILINGGNRGLGLGFVKKLLSKAPHKIFATYRSTETANELLDLAANNSQVLVPILADSTREEDVGNVAKMVSQETNKLNLVMNCVGYFHNNEHGPEKSLRQIDANQLLESAKIKCPANITACKIFSEASHA